MSDLEKYGLSFNPLSDDERTEWKEISKWYCYYDEDEAEPDFRGLDSKSAYVLGQIADACLDENWRWLCQTTAMYADVVHKNKDSELFCRVLRRSYECAVLDGDDGACCDLGNMHHDTSNAGLEEDYAIAEKLYLLGAERGCDQASVNLGYIYYYGRGQEADYAKAYECYARAAIARNRAVCKAFA